MAQIYNGQLDAFELYHKYHDSSFESQAFPAGGPPVPALAHALAGAVGAAISNIATYPLSLIVTQLQVRRCQRKEKSDGPSNALEPEQGSMIGVFQGIYKENHRLQDFYTGLGPDTIKTIADSFLFFLAYNFLWHRSRSRNKSLVIVNELGIGFVSGAFCKVLTTPLANLVTRLQSSGQAHDVSLRSTLQHVYRSGGLRSFWAGYTASLILTLNPALTFLFHGFISRLLRRTTSTSKSSKASTIFFLAALSKTMASIITYPFSSAKTRIQAGSAPLPKVSAGIIGLVLQIIRLEGVWALYTGLQTEIMKGFFTHGITMMMKEVILATVIRLYMLVTRWQKYRG